MAVNIVYSDALKISGTPPESIPTISITETPTNGSSSSEVITIKDINVTRTTTSPATNNCKLNVIRALEDQLSAFASMTPAICSVNSLGNATGLSNGQGVIAVYTPYHIRKFTRTFSNAETVISDAFHSWFSNPLSGHVDNSIRAMINNNTAGASTQAVLSSTSGGASSPNHIRNTSLFTGALDLSAISVYGTAYNSNMFPVVLISPRHVIAGHVGASPSQQIVFKAPNGTYEVRTIISQVRLNVNFGEDYVGLLDSDITTITPMKLLPSTWKQFLPNYAQSPFLAKFPLLNKGWTAGDHIRILEATGFLASNSNFKIILANYISGDFQPWSSPVVGGDSNGPVFIPINGEPILLHCMHYANGGIFYPNDSAGIQAAMTAQGPGSLTYADLSSFTSY